jgi:hypothetical protein
VEQSAYLEGTPMLMSFHLHEYLAAFISGGIVLVFIILLILNGIDDYRNGRNSSTWRKPYEQR